MILDPPLHRVTCEDKGMSEGNTSSFVAENIVAQSSHHEFRPEAPTRPPFSSTLSYASSSSNTPTPYKAFPSSVATGSLYANSFGSQDVRPQPRLSRSHSNGLLEITSGSTHSQISSTTEFEAYGSHPPQYSQSSQGTNAYVQHPESTYEQTPFGYHTANLFASQPQPDSAMSFHSSAAWNDGQFDFPPSQGLTAMTLGSSFDLLPMQWTENFENILAEGLDVNQEDRDTPSTPSVEGEVESTQLPPLRPPTSHPAPHTNSILPPPSGSTEEKPTRLTSEYLGYEYWDQRDMHRAVENMEVLKASTILIQDNARKLRATGQPIPCRFGNVLSNIKLSADKRDDIKSMLDDTYAHSRLMYPSEKEAQRLPRLEIFNILLKSYFHNFHAQHPILHLPSLLSQDGSSGLDKKKDILIYAMCCAGAFRHAARPIQEYARGMQELLRRTFNYHFEKDPRNVRDLQSMQAWHLSIFIGGWSGSARASEAAQAACAGLDSMLRCGHFLDGQRGDWFEDEQRPVEPGTELERWKVFVEREEKKRLIFAQLWFESHQGSFMRVRPNMTFSELTLPVPCELDLWRAETADEWAKLWNNRLATRLPRGDDDLFEPATICLLRQFAKWSTDFSTASQFARRGEEYGRHLPALLLGIHSMVVTVSENRSCMTWESRANAAAVLECKTMLKYWWALRDACPVTTATPITRDWLEFSSTGFTVDATPELLASLDISAVLYHFTSLMLYIPLREIRLMNERNYLPIRKTAATRLWRTWKDNNGEDAKLGLWHAGQIIRLARIMIDNETGPLWLAPMVAEAANVMWSYAALIYLHDQIQRGAAFNGEYFVLDSGVELDKVSISARNNGMPCITNRKGDLIPLSDAHSVVTECAELINRGPLVKRMKQPRGRTILDEQFVSQLDKLVKFGNIEFLVAGLQEGVAKK